MSNIITVQLLSYYSVKIMKQFRGKSFLSMKNLSEIAKTAVRRKLFTLLGRFVKQTAVIIISEKKNTYFQLHVC